MALLLNITIDGTPLFELEKGQHDKGVFFASALRRMSSCALTLELLSTAAIIRENVKYLGFQFILCRTAYIECNMDMSALVLSKLLHCLPR